MEKSNSNSFIKGAFILGAAGMIIKILGAFFRIPLGNLIGDEGMGYFQSSYPIYVLLGVISTAGFPTAIAKLVSEKIAIGDEYGAERIFKVSFMALLVVGISTSSLLFFGARFYTNYFLKNPKAYYSTLAIAPALFFVPIMSSFRGYFQGLQNMKPTAVSQIAEQIGRVVLGLALAYILLDKKLEIAAAGAAFGASAGGLFGAIIITYIFFRYKRKKGEFRPKGEIEDTSTILNKLLKIAIPIAIGAAVVPIMQTIDAGIIMRRLQDIGYDEDTANSLFGQLTGMANPLINFPQVLIAAIQVSLVPAVSHFVTRRDIRSLNTTVEAGLRVALLIGLPAAIGLVILAKPIMILLYPLQIESAVNASKILSVLGFGVIFLSIYQTLTGVLQGIGKPFIPVRNLFVGALVKLVLSYILIGIPTLTIRGAAIATVIGYGIAAILNLIYIKSHINMRFNFVNVFLKPAVSVTIMAIAVRFTYSIINANLGNNKSTLISITLGAVVYGIMLLLTKTLNEEDFGLMPGGKKIYKIARIFYRK
ncbi:putative polysaccharide biosynthesis protein [Maledivibacter halophilus]|uniref:Stage V sporulation protein B n=1 Tax=Maledivibacter halophilus TaxID=36842 RepID=A0A1T5MSG8_9FIRM|nr:polysaccharide biosynthesis protein [Maledivibacter halophilus]SKC91177.1 stage V sporulation protein B [Maledivibacter halophilus]